MACFEDLKLGDIFTVGGLVVDADQAADFAQQYDPQYVPKPGIAYVHRGPEISPWQAAALSWKLLADLAANTPAGEIAFLRPANLNWHTRVSVGDELRLEVEVTEIFPPQPRFPQHGWAGVKVTLITTGAAGFGAWSDDDAERVDDIALTYTAHLQALRRNRASIQYGID